MALRRNPIVYEINTWVWLVDLSAHFGRKITLGNIPPEVIDEIVALCPDAVWLMGVWERSPKGCEIALNMATFSGPMIWRYPISRLKILSGLPMPSTATTVDQHLGGHDELAVFVCSLTSTASR